VWKNVITTLILILIGVEYLPMKNVQDCLLTKKMRLLEDVIKLEHNSQWKWVNIIPLSFKKYNLEMPEISIHSVCEDGEILTQFFKLVVDYKVPGLISKHTFIKTMFIDSEEVDPKEKQDAMTLMIRSIFICDESGLPPDITYLDTFINTLEKTNSIYLNYMLRLRRAFKRISRHYASSSILGKGFYLNESFVLDYKSFLSNKHRASQKYINEQIRKEYKLDVYKHFR
jgi:hypothetical protein